MPNSDTEIGGASDQDGPLADDIFDGFLAAVTPPDIPADIPADGPSETPTMPAAAANPFAFADPPTGVWDVYASNGYGDGGNTCCGLGIGVAATGTLALTPSSQNGGAVYGDGVINLMLADMNSAATDLVQAGETGGFPGDAFVGDAEGAGTFSPFFTSGIGEGVSMSSGNNPGDVADIPDVFADGAVNTAGSLINGSAANNNGAGFFVAGQRTPSAYLQSQHDQALVGEVQGNFQGATFHTEHSVSIDVDFAAATWGGSFTDGVVDEQCCGAEAHNFTASGGFNGQGIGVSDTIAGGASAGTVIFSFFGPQAQALGGNVNVTGPDVVIRDTFSALRGGDPIAGGFVPPQPD